MTAVDEDVRKRLEVEARRWVEGDADGVIAQLQQQLAATTAMVGQLRHEATERGRNNDGVFLGLGGRLANAESNLAITEQLIQNNNKRLARIETWFGAARWAGGLCILYLAAKVGWGVWSAW